MDMQAKKDLQKFAVSIRKETMRAIGTLGVGHVGGALSICDVLAVLYGGEMNIDPADPGWFAPRGMRGRRYTPRWR